MSDHRLNADQLSELSDAHRACTDKRLADRIKATYLLGRGWSSRQVAEALLIDKTTALHHAKRYRQGGVDKLLSWDYEGSDSYLDEAQPAELAQDLDSQVFSTAAEVARHIQERWDVNYSERGVIALLHRMGYVYKKAKGIPGKADAARQEAFLEEYQKLRQGRAAQAPVYFTDAVHPQHNPVLSHGWFRRGADREVLTNTGRRRLNIHGAIDIQTMSAVVRYEEWVNAEATLRLFQGIEESHPEAPEIFVICDNASYYRAQSVQDYLLKSRIRLLFLPPYSPNLNLIERLWKFFKRSVLYNRYYPTFDNFKKACRGFFENLSDYQAQLRSLLTENFEIISAT